MVVNTLSVLAAFGAIVRVVAGMILVVAGVRALRRRKMASGQERQERFYLAFLFAVSLLGLSVVSWPLLYLVLESYVPLWPGIMCVQGVQRIGEGSVGSASLMPPLLDFLEYSKPALVFSAGAWFVLHLANRTGRFAGRVLAALLGFGLLAILDGVAEAAYLFIPNKENVPAAGCCMTGDGAGLWSGAGVFYVQSDAGPTPLMVAFFAVGGAVVLASALALRRWRRAREFRPWLLIAFGAAIVSLPVGLAFLGAVAAPAFLRLSFHHCVYCLVATAPESLAAIGAMVLGGFSVGWAATAHWCAAGSDEEGGIVVSLLRVAWFGYLAALLMTGVRLATR